MVMAATTVVTMLMAMVESDGHGYMRLMVRGWLLLLESLVAMV